MIHNISCSITVYENTWNSMVIYSTVSSMKCLSCDPVLVHTVLCRLYTCDNSGWLCHPLSTSSENFLWHANHQFSLWASWLLAHIYTTAVILCHNASVIAAHCLTHGEEQRWQGRRWARVSWGAGAARGGHFQHGQSSHENTLKPCHLKRSSCGGAIFRTAQRLPLT